MRLAFGDSFPLEGKYDPAKKVTKDLQVLKGIFWGAVVESGTPK